MKRKNLTIAKKAMAVFMVIMMLFTSVPVMNINFGKFIASATDGDDSDQHLDILNSDEARIEMNFNKNWLFNLGDVSTGYTKTCDETGWKNVSLPHDYSITQNYTTTNTDAESGFLPGGTGWYRKWFTLPSGLANKQLVITFDGVYENSYIYINGQLVCENHYGYNAFSVDITDYVTCDGTTANFIAVKTVSEFANSRFYAGAGITRDVTLTATEKVHVGLYGLSVTTPVTGSGKNQTLTGAANGKVRVQNDGTGTKNVTVKGKVLNAGGSVVSDVKAASASVGAGSSTTVTVSPVVSNPSVWDTNSPNLYTFVAEIYDGDELVDSYETKFGYRTIYFDSDTGFYLNNNKVKIKGVCMHSDQGALGSIQTYDSIYRQIAILKDMGANAIRTSHNVPSSLLLKVCDELGMLVDNEFFDGWYAAKNSNSHDFSEYWNVTINTGTNKVLDAVNGEIWARFVVEQSVKRDLNSPSVIMWSVGNEITEGTSNSNLYSDTTTSNNLAAWVHNYDTTRPTTIGINKGAWQNINISFDVIGTNYNVSGRDTVAAAAKNNGKSFILSETASAITSRGVYYKSGNNQSNNELTSYDTNTVGWGETATAAWYNTISHDNYSGEFVWTGFDYLGEPTPWNNTTGGSISNPNSSFFGIIDTAGFGKDTYYLYRSWWNTESTTLHLIPGTWDSSQLVSDNGYTYVGVYSNAARIELLLNGTVIGRATKSVQTTSAGYTYPQWTETAVDTSKVTTTEFDTATGSSLYAQFRVKPTAGTLSVKAYDASGNEITDTVGTKSISSTVTASSATKVVAKVWKDADGNPKKFTSDGESYIYFELEAQDANGNFVNDYDGTINVAVDTDTAIIAGVDNGNAASIRKGQQSSVLPEGRHTAQVDLYNGRALVIVRTTDTPGTITLSQNKTSSELNLVGASAVSVRESGDELLDEFEEICPQGTEYDKTLTLNDRYDTASALVGELGQQGGAGQGGSGSTDSDEPTTIVDDALYTKYNATKTEDGGVETLTPWDGTETNVIEGTEASVTYNTSETAWTKEVVTSKTPVWYSTGASGTPAVATASYSASAVTGASAGAALQSGYYILKGASSTYAYDNGSGMKHTTTVPSTNGPDLRFVWYWNKDEGTLKNVLTGNYISIPTSNTQIQTGESGSTGLTSSWGSSSQKWKIGDGTWWLNQGGSDNVVAWYQADDGRNPNSWWDVYPVTVTMGTQAASYSTSNPAGQNGGTLPTGDYVMLGNGDNVWVTESDSKAVWSSTAPSQTSTPLSYIWHWDKDQGTLRNLGTGNYMSIPASNNADIPTTSSKTVTLTSAWRSANSRWGIGNGSNYLNKRDNSVFKTYNQLDAGSSFAMYPATVGAAAEEATYTVNTTAYTSTQGSTTLPVGYYLIAGYNNNDGGSGVTKTSYLYASGTSTTNVSRNTSVPTSPSESYIWYWDGTGFKNEANGNYITNPNSNSSRVTLSSTKSNITPFYSTTGSSANHWRFNFTGTGYYFHTSDNSTLIAYNAANENDAAGSWWNVYPVTKTVSGQEAVKLYPGTGGSSTISFSLDRSDFSKALFSLAKNNDYYVLSNSAGSTIYYLSSGGSSAQVPFTQASKNLRIEAASNGKFTIYNTDNGRYINFSVSEHHFDRSTSVATGNNDSYFDIYLYDTTSEAEPYPHFTKITSASQLTPGKQYMIGHEGSDGNFYVFYAGGDSNGWQGVARAQADFTTTTTTVTEVPDGWYAIYGADSNGGTSGILTSEAVTVSKGYSAVGLKATGSAVTSTSQAWKFEKQSSGKYHIYTYDEYYDKVYLNISGSSSNHTSSRPQITTSETAQELNVTLNSNNTITIGNTSGIYINFYGSNWDNDTSHLVAYWTGGTALTLYSSDVTVVEATEGKTEVKEVSYVPTGDYIIYGADGNSEAASGTLTNASAVSNANSAIKGIRCTGSAANHNDTVWHIERLADGKYNISAVDADGTVKYIHINGTNNVTLADDAAELSITVNSDKTVVIKNSAGTTGLNWFGKGHGQIVSGYSSGTNATLYPVTANTGIAPVENGNYVVYKENKEQVLSSVSANGQIPFASSSYGSFLGSSEEYLKTSPSNELTFTNLGGNVYYVTNSEGKYLTISANGLSYGDSANKVVVVGRDDHNVLIRNYDNDSYLYVYNDVAAAAFLSNNGYAGVAGDETQEVQYVMSLYKKQATMDEIAGYDVCEYEKYTPGVAIKNGYYIVYAPGVNRVLTPVISSSNNSTQFTKVSDDSEIFTNVANEFKITYAGISDSGEILYYVQNPEGKYLTSNVGTGDGSPAFSDTAATCKIRILSTGQVAIVPGEGEQHVDTFTANKWSTWYGDASTNPNQNEKFILYRKPVKVEGEEYNIYDGIKGDLLRELQSATGLEIGRYGADSVLALVAAMENAIEVYNDTSASAELVEAARVRLQNALAALEANITEFEATIYKYGYNPAGTQLNTKYLNAGDFNLDTWNTYKSALLNNANIVSQIEAIVDATDANGNAVITFADDTARQNAIEAIAYRYAQIYSLYFNGVGVTDSSSSNSDVPVAKTVWNFWEKSNTTGVTTNDGGRNQGASIQGIYNTNLNESGGVPASHDAYEILSYINDSTNNQGVRALETISVANGSGTNVSLTLPALENISVYVPDFFSKHDVEDSRTDTATDYNKYYWNTHFPFTVETDSYGVNTYVFDSHSEDYLFRAYYDDENHTAVSKLTSTDAVNAHLHQQGSDIRSFLPFNYQLTEAQANGEALIEERITTRENAIYHFGMTFSTEFYMPTAGKYTNNEDIVFNFSGDDDVLVYVDGKLILDNGGLHGARTSSINFTDCSVSYQYALDINEMNENGKATIKSTTENDVVYRYGDTYGSADSDHAYTISADSQAAVDYLNQIKGDGKDHILTFYYLERGSSASNCLISFNMQPNEGSTKLKNETLVSDFGLDIDYDIKDNNLNKRKITDSFYYDYVGVILESDDAAEKLPRLNNKMEGEYDTSVFDYEIPQNGSTVEIPGVYGTLSINNKGVAHYTQKNMQFSGYDRFYVVAKVVGDPLYQTGISYYAYELLTYLPATSIYYEDNYLEGTENGITYKNGVDSKGGNYGEWIVVSDETAAAVNQAADLAGDLDANNYGYDGAYANFGKYSNGSAHKVSVSPNNSGNQNKNWPSASFTMAGTGFDLVSLTNKESGVFTVTITDTTTNKVVQKKIVDTYYGFSYGQVYRTADGQPTLEQYVTDGQGNRIAENTIMYRRPKEEVKDENDEALLLDIRRFTSSVTYYNSMGDIVRTPMFKQADGSISENVTDEPNYAYAFGWLNDANSDSNSLYQIPVLAIRDLSYSTYKVNVEARYAETYKHYNVASDGTHYYDLYLDAVRVYDPAGEQSETGSVPNQVISEAYLSDNEAFTYYSEIKDMIIGADTIDADGHEGALFIDGRSAIGSDSLDAYLEAGPNNELYLDGGQAIAFEIWTTTVPKDVQIGVKTAKMSEEGEYPALDIVYKNDSVEAMPIETSTAMYYSVNHFLDNSNNLAWSLARDSEGNFICDENGNSYYSSGTIVISNAADKGAVLSITNLKWTFAKYGSTGYYRIPTALNDEAGTLYVESGTAKRAMFLLSADRADLSIDEDSVEVQPVTENGKVTVTFTTGTDVNTVIVKDENGNVINLDSVESVINKLDNGEEKLWTVTLVPSTEPGTYTYNVVGVYDEEYTGNGTSISFTVTVESEEEPIIDPSQPDDSDDQTVEKELSGLQKFFQKIRDFFRKLLAFFGINI